ncbi:unnamed protein product (macronuclear) [Paramecium tetraurelia]|uniref:Uncharacterized protein n=1 Tax=Paramecium tetraurelia TaxID=5888 RepID=A0CDG2_PARTE|nr:uncharacterized protein GSPATT00007040001 [Paramecium tetraurelia]CAK68829.1 unnamed protein product [Paramecium tetraurelia]|eukprot:XP_001436226.1 hypothetical protein (macronuclear) [Paramecium tetraurelia strain d4-2]
MNQISQNILVQKLIDYKLRHIQKEQKQEKGQSLVFSTKDAHIIKIDILFKWSCIFDSLKIEINSKLTESIHSSGYATVSDLLDLLSQMFRIIQQYEQQACHLWSKNLEMLKQIKIPILQENEDLKLAVETLKQNDIQNSVYGQLKEYEQIEKPKPKLIDLQHINRDSNFQEEFMSKVNEFSLSWRQEVQQLKQL